MGSLWNTLDMCRTLLNDAAEAEDIVQQHGTNSGVPERLLRHAQEQSLDAQAGRLGVFDPFQDTCPRTLTDRCQLDIGGNWNEAVMALA